MSTKRISGIICGCAFCVWLATCIEVTRPDYFDDNGDTLILKFGETKIGQSSGVRLTFTEVLEDYRCLENNMWLCYLGGQSSIQVSLNEKQQKSANVILPIYGCVFIDDSVLHIAVDTLGYSLKLLQLDPYPEDPVEPDYRSYEATIFIKSIGEM